MCSLSTYEPGGVVEISLTTWNLEGTCGPAKGSDLLQPGTHHVYVIGTEECERGIAASYVNNSKTKWEEKLCDALGEDYKLIASETLMAIHIIMFARQDVAKHITQVSSDHVATGLLNGTVGNKGGVCISCLIGDTSLLFVNAHFAAHQDNVGDRNNDFKRICFSTNLRSPKLDRSSASPSPAAADGQESETASGVSPPRQSSPLANASSRSQSPKEPKGSVDITECFDVVFWSGDLNYRINGLRNMVDVLLKDESYRDVLLANDQLLLEQKKGNVFQGFSEGSITFNPTYKFHKEDGKSTTEYDKSAKCRIPAWTDRILFKTNPPFDPSHLQLNSYTSLDHEGLRVSDHRPVVASVSLKTMASPSLVPSELPTQSTSRTCLIT